MGRELGRGIQVWEARRHSHVLILDHDDLRTPFRHIAVFQNCRRASFNKPVPK